MRRQRNIEEVTVSCGGLRFFVRNESGVSRADLDPCKFDRQRSEGAELRLANVALAEMDHLQMREATFLAAFFRSRPGAEEGSPLLVARDGEVLVQVAGGAPRGAPDVSPRQWRPDGSAGARRASGASKGLRVSGRSARRAVAPVEALRLGRGQVGVGADFSDLT
jgi:hypothetical protein